MKNQIIQISAYGLLFICFVGLMVFIAGNEMEFLAWRNSIIERLRFKFGDFEQWDQNLIVLCDFNGLYKFGLTVDEAVESILETYEHWSKYNAV